MTGSRSRERGRGQRTHSKCKWKLLQENLNFILDVHSVNQSINKHLLGVAMPWHCPGSITAMKLSETQLLPIFKFIISKKQDKDMMMTKGRMR